MFYANRLSFVLIIFAFLESWSTAVYTPAGGHDNGCFASYRAKYFRGQPLPSCLEGGLWKHFQCQNLYSCYCVYVDTGNILPLYSHWSHFYFFSYFTAATKCPVKMQKNKPSDDLCKVPRLNYPCNLNQTKYVFNLRSQSCESTKGCFGFASRQDCESECTVQVYDECSFPENRGRYCSGESSETRYRNDPATGQCVAFTYRGCGGNSNNYASSWECERTCVSQSNISVIVNIENVRTYNLTLPQWVLNQYQLLDNETNNVTEEQFEEFGQYAVGFELLTDEQDEGSRNLIVVNGNPNRKSFNQRLREILSPYLVCGQPSFTGDCRAYKPRWYYDPLQEKCKSFIYGGCGGNGNNFRDAFDCSDYCNARILPSPEELVADPTDDYGNVISDLLGRNRVVLNQNGELLYKIPITTGDTTSGVSEGSGNTGNV